MNRQTIASQAATPLGNVAASPIHTEIGAIQPSADDLAAMQAVEPLLLALKTGDFHSRWDAAKAIPTLGIAAIEPLLTLLQAELAELDEDSDWELLWFIARILGSFNHPLAIAALTELLQSADAASDAELIAMTATTLTHFGTIAVPALEPLLANPATRLIGIQAFAQIRQAEVVAPLLSVVNDAVPEVRAAAIEALSHFYDPTITAMLRTALQDSAMMVRRAAVIALGIQADRSEPASLVAALKPLLWDLHPEVCRQTAIALGRVGEAAVAVLAEVLQSPHTPLELQIEIVRSLVWIGSKTALLPLQDYLSAHQITPAQSLLVQEMMAMLGRVESPETRHIAVQILLNLLEAADPIAQTVPAKQQIALSLGQLGDSRAIPALIQLLADRELSVRLHTIAALKQFPTAHAELQTRLQDLTQDLTTDHSLANHLEAGIRVALQEW